MPRITGPSIAEHVAAQEAAVVDAARRLFAERGVAAVSLGDIAAAVGLGRTSLYRYFPTKAHILQRWFDLEMDPLLERSREVASAPGEAGDRLRSWLGVQLDFLLDDSHAGLSEASAAPGALPAEVLAHFGARHHELYATIDDILREGGATDPHVRRARALLIAGLIRSAGELVKAGTPESTARAELERAATAVASV